jgi:hypothetical protein
MRSAHLSSCVMKGRLKNSPRNKTQQIPEGRRESPLTFLASFLWGDFFE